MGQIITTRLTEDRTPLSGRGVSVDTQACVVRGVKVAGLTSPNAHGVAGAKSTRYEPDAFRDAARLYEGAPAFLDHTYGDGTTRSVRDRFGWIRSPAVTATGLVGDLEYNPHHPFAAEFVAGLERGEDYCCLSHNVVGVGEVDAGGVFVVKEITRVHSVDVVAKGATTKTLFEGDSMGTAAVTPPAKKQGNQDGRKAEIKAILKEMEELVEQAGSTPSSFMDSLGDMFKAIVADASLDVEEKVEKLKAAVEMLKKAEKSGEAEIPEEDDDEEDDISESLSPSQELAKLKAENQKLKLEGKAAALLQESGIEADAELIDLLSGLGDEKKIAAKVKSLAKIKESPRGTAGTGARSVSAHQRQSGQSSPAKDAAELKNRLLMGAN